MQTALHIWRRARGVVLTLAIALCALATGSLARAEEPGRETGSVSLITGTDQAGPSNESTVSGGSGIAKSEKSDLIGLSPADADHPAAGVKENDVIRRVPKRSTGKTGSTGTPVSGSRDLLKMLQPAGLVLLAIGVLAFVARRWLPQARQAAGGGAAIQVLARQHLSAKQSLCLVRLGRGLVLVGVTPDQISTVAQIQDPEETAEVVARIERTRGRSFTQTMTRFAGREAEPLDAADDAADVEPIVRGGDLGSSPDRIREMVRRVRALAELSLGRGERGSRRESA